MADSSISLTYMIHSWIATLVNIRAEVFQNVYYESWIWASLQEISLANGVYEGEEEEEEALDVYLSS